mgnify:FL=1
MVSTIASPLQRKEVIKGWGHEKDPILWCYRPFKYRLFRQTLGAPLRLPITPRRPSTCPQTKGEVSSRIRKRECPEMKIKNEIYVFFREMLFLKIVLFIGCWSPHFLFEVPWRWRRWREWPKCTICWWNPHLRYAYEPNEHEPWREHSCKERVRISLKGFFLFFVQDDKCIAFFQQWKIDEVHNLTLFCDW